LTANRALGGVRGDSLLPQFLGKLLAPMTQRRFADVQPLPLLAHSFHNHMDVWMRLIRVHHESVPMLKGKFIRRKITNCLLQSLQ